MIFALLLQCVLVLCVCAWWWGRKWRMMRLTARVPTLLGALPILGHSYQLWGGPSCVWKCIEKWTNEVNDAVGVAKLWFGPKLIIVVTDPEIALSVLNRCTQKSLFNSFFLNWLGDGLITSNGPVWQKHRKLISPAFTQRVIDDYLEIFNQQSNVLVKALSENVGKGEFDPSQLVSESTLETICQTAIGLPANKTKIVSKRYFSAINGIMTLIVNRVANILLYPNFVYNWTASRREEMKLVNILRQTTGKVLVNSKYLETSTNNYSQLEVSHRMKPFLELLLGLGKEGYLTDTEIRDEVETIIAAGYSTTSGALIILLVVLGSYPEVQKRVYEEIKNVFNEPCTCLKKEKLSELVYLEAVIKETLRLYPTIPLFLRQIDKDLKFDNFTIPAGCEIIICSWGIHRNKKIWGNNAEDFKPERWLDSSTLPDHPAAYTSFSLGKRHCVGKKYAIMSLKTTLAHVLRKYTVRADCRKLKLQYEVGLRPESGHYISIESI